MTIRNAAVFLDIDLDTFATVHHYPLYEDG